MKRITVWIDSKNENIKQVYTKLKELNSVDTHMKIVNVCDIRTKEEK